MDTNKLKEGVSVKEIESFTRKHRFEVFFCLIFILACFFSFVFFTAWVPILGAVGGIIGVLLPEKMQHFLRKMFGFVFKQEQVTQLILGVAGLIVAIFLPPLIFFFLGVHGGKSIHFLAAEIHGEHKE